MTTPERNSLPVSSAATPVVHGDSASKPFKSLPVRLTVAIGVPVAVLLVVVVTVWAERTVKEEPLSYRVTAISLSYALPAFFFLLGGFIGFWIGRVRPPGSREPSA